MGKFFGSAGAARLAMYLVLIVLFLVSCVSAPPPKVSADVPAISWISPSNQDGYKDELSFPVSIIPDTREPLQFWRIQIADSTGGTVRTIERIEPEGKGLLDSLLVSLRLKRRPGIEAPELVVWDGRNDAGAWAPDGEYSLMLEVRAGKQTVRSGPYRIIVDTVPPVVGLSADYTLFSPNGDGNKDALTVVQLTEPAEHWTGSVVNASGNAVLVKSWNGMPDSQFVWPGNDGNGKSLPDGLYSYELSGIDQAGNRNSARLDGIAINRTDLPFFVGLSGKAFSPNGDGIRDKLYIQPVMEALGGAVHWSLRILDQAGNVVHEARQLPFSAYAWDGTAPDGRTAPEGLYQVRAAVVFSNGNSPERQSDPVRLDLTVPAVKAAPRYRAFSPEGDGLQDTMPFTLQAVAQKSLELQWVAEIIRGSDGVAVRSQALSGLPDTVEWDGLDNEGYLSPDGRYFLRLRGEDEAGNQFTHIGDGFLLDIRETPAELRLEASGFSPNGDGFRDSLPMDVYLPLKQGLEWWSVELQDSNGSVVAGSGQLSATALPDRYEWNGMDAAGRLVPDGSYRARFRARYEKGNVAEAVSREFRVDTMAPESRIVLDNLPFSPDGDSYNDILGIQLLFDDRSPISEWNAVIRDRTGAAFASFNGIGINDLPLLWNGRGTSGELVMSAEDYQLRVTVRDQYGNTASSETTIPVDILVLKEGNRYRIQVPGIYFEPFRDTFPADKSAQNMATLRRLAEILAKYPDYQIRIEGHAVRINWADMNAGLVEERDVLGPLSLSRANRVRTLLTGMGLAAARMSTAGLGGTIPLVPHSDLDNRWKNRRVDFVLIRR